MSILSRFSLVSLSLACALTLGGIGTVSAQPTRTPVAGATTNFATVTVTGIGDQATVDAEFRLPIMPSNVAWNAASHHLRLRATGTRAIREIVFEIDRADTETSLSLGGAGTSVRIRMQDGTEVLTGRGTQGSITIDQFDGTQAKGHYEATIPRGRTSVLLRGQFQANLLSVRPSSRPPVTP